MDDTDSQLKKEWEAAEAAMSSAATPEERKQIDAQMDFIRLRWHDVLLRRKRGVLTDTTNIDAVEKIVNDAAKWQGLRIELKRTEGPRNEFHIAQDWFLRVMYIGDRKTFNLKAWDKFIDEVEGEIEERPYIRWCQGTGRSFDHIESEMPPGYWERRLGPDEEDDDEDEYDEDFDDEGEDEPEPKEPAVPVEMTEQEKEDASYRRECYTWCISTIVWTGPPPKRR